MIVLHVILEGDGAWPDLGAKLADGRAVWLSNDAPPVQVAALAGGMESGLPSLAIRIDTPDGRTVVAEVSLRLFLAAADAFRARFGSH